MPSMPSVATNLSELSAPPDGLTSGSPPEHALPPSRVSEMLQAAASKGVLDGDPDCVSDAPVAVFYDLDLVDKHVGALVALFGNSFRHHAAVKSCPFPRMLRHLHVRHGLGIECASLGEVLNGEKACGIPPSRIVFDSPCKTVKELRYTYSRGMHINLDNFDEYKRMLAVKAEVSTEASSSAVVGLRVNPLVGAGEIKELSVSTPDSKFGIPITAKAEILAAYQESPWLNSVHVHVGSGKMGMGTLSAGIRVAVELAQTINSTAGRAQITHVDIGGGLPANYGSDAFDNGDSAPSYAKYAAHLREAVPELFSEEFTVVTEFGQSLFAKLGFLASRIEYLKRPGNIAIIHFGADCCLRQAYTAAHGRRMEVYKSSGEEFASSSEEKFSVAGPLCFQGDFLTKDAPFPAELLVGDIVVLKDAGANSLSLFSRHCSRFCPPAYGFRSTGTGHFEVIKPRETPESLINFWGGKMQDAEA
ncbi:unnamed protein product [Amoebophrya sp. A25]|nr:unnamed protein product [Amoebophrya sp. A25]|eukprot:GSA25T00015653001.1